MLFPNWRWIVRTVEGYERAVHEIRRLHSPFLRRLIIVSEGTRALKRHREVSKREKGYERARRGRKRASIEPSVRMER